MEKENWIDRLEELRSLYNERENLETRKVAAYMNKHAILNVREIVAGTKFSEEKRKELLHNMEDVPYMVIDGQETECAMSDTDMKDGTHLVIRKKELGSAYYIETWKDGVRKQYTRITEEGCNQIKNKLQIDFPLE